MPAGHAAAKTPHHASRPRPGVDGVFRRHFVNGKDSAVPAQNQVFNGFEFLMPKHQRRARGLTQKGGPVSEERFRRRDADGGGREVRTTAGWPAERADRPPEAVSDDRGLARFIIYALA